MSLPNYLAKIKSSGIYRFVWDKSEVTATDAETLRLVMGYSEKGPFNTVVYIDNAGDFKKIFGDINKKLEKRGVFFHRMALQALQTGPILAFNVKKFGDTEKVQYATATCGNSKLVTDASATALATKVYDTTRFWTIDPEQLTSFDNADSADKAGGKIQYLTVSATDSKETSNTIFMRPASNSNYDVTIKTWYSTMGEEMPDYFMGYENLLVSDFLVDAYVFKGEFTKELAETIELKKYFDTTGDKVVVKSTITNAFGQEIDALDALAANENSMFVQKYSGIMLPEFKDAQGYYMSLDIIFNKDYDLHKMIMKFNSDLLDTTDVTPKDLVTKPSIAEGASTVQVLSAEYKKGDEGDAVLLDKVYPTYLEGYTYSKSKPENNTPEKKLEWQNDILDAINPDSSKGYPGLVEALSNGTDIDYRYIVDTFESYPTTECKGKLALLAKKKDNCMLLTNFPSIKTFAKMSDFTTNGAFDINKVKTSGKFSLPSAENGASWCSFNTPIVFTDGTIKTTVPAAAMVSNKFMDKYTSRQPYYIVAGPKYSRFVANGLVGPDYNFSRDELDVLEPMGVNATVYVPRKGTFINSNQTAKQTPVTALSKINVRELVIYLQDQIHDLLQDYHWDLNTSTLRDLVKAKADTICELVQGNGGIYNFLNVCDETNNTDDVINNEMLVLNTYIEPGMGAGKMVQELTIYKKGGMTAVIS